MVVPVEVLIESESTVWKVVEQDPVVDEKFVLDGAVKPLSMGVHLGGLGIRAPMDEMKPAQVLVEVFEKLTAVVGEDMLHGVGKQVTASLKELGCSPGGMRGCDVGKCPPRVEVNERNDVDLPPPEAKLDGVQGHTVSWMGGSESLWFTVFFLSLWVHDGSVMAHLLWEGAHLVWLVGDEPADGLLTRTGEASLTTKRTQVNEDLLLSKVGMLGSHPADLLGDDQRPLPHSHVLWPLGLLIETFGPTITPFELSSPGIQCASGDLECLQGR